MATRRLSDVSSGLELRRADYPGFSDEDVARNFDLFKHYDLDNSGFITADNMLEVLKALDMDVSIEMVLGMIEEVAVLTGHANDGQLSFRDFMNMAFHDQQAAAAESHELAHSPAVDAEAEGEQQGDVFEGEQQSDAAEAEAEVDEPESPVGAPACEPRPTTEESSGAPPPPPPPTKRRSSLSSLNALAAGRIKTFQEVANEAAEREKLTKFKKQPVQVTGPMVNSEDMHLETLQSKLKAFEVAAHFKGKTELRKTWKKVGGASNYQSGNKILLGGMPVGVAPKKKLADLP